MFLCSSLQFSWCSADNSTEIKLLRVCVWVRCYTHTHTWMCIWRAFGAVVAIHMQGWPVSGFSFSSGYGYGSDSDTGHWTLGSGPSVRPLTIKVNEYFNIGKQITHMGNDNSLARTWLAVEEHCMELRGPARNCLHSSNGVKFNSIELNCCWHNASKVNAKCKMQNAKCTTVCQPDEMFHLFSVFSFFFISYFLLRLKIIK